MRARAPLPDRSQANSSIPLAIAFATSIVSVSGVNLVYPILPAIADGLAIDEARVGLIIAAFALPAVVLAPLFGLYADFYGRRWLLIFGLIVFAAAGTAAASATSFHWLLIWRTVQGIGVSALMPLTIVLISDLCPERDQELQAQGWKVAIDRVAMIVLPVLGGVLAIYSWKYGFLPFALVFPVAVAALFLMPETKPPLTVSGYEYFRDIALAVKDTRVSLAFAIGFVRFFLDYGFFIYLPLFLTLRYQQSVVVAGIMLAISAAGAIITAMTVRHLSRHTSVYRLLVYAFLITAIGLAAILARPPLWIVAIGSFGIGLGNGLISPLQKSLITQNAPPAMRGGVVSCDRVVQQIAKALAPALLGLLLVIAPMEGVFIALIALGLAGAAMMLFAERSIAEVM